MEQMAVQFVPTQGRVAYGEGLVAPFSDEIPAFLVDSEFWYSDVGHVAPFSDEIPRFQFAVSYGLLALVQWHRFLTRFRRFESTVNFWSLVAPFKGDKTERSHHASVHGGFWMNAGLHALGNYGHYFVLALYLTVTCSMSGEPCIGPFRR